MDEKAMIQQAKKDYEEKQEFLLNGVEPQEVFPEIKLLGDIKAILGYEPENYYLEQCFELNGNLMVSAASPGNGWLIYGKTEKDFEQEILEKLQLMYEPKIHEIAEIELSGHRQNDGSIKLGEYIAGETMEDFPKTLKTPYGIFQLKSIKRDVKENDFLENHPQKHAEKAVYVKK